MSEITKKKSKDKTEAIFDTPFIIQAESEKYNMIALQECSKLQIKL